jgi:hypothetical protein
MNCQARQKWRAFCFFGWITGLHLFHAHSRDGKICVVIRHAKDILSQFKGRSKYLPENYFQYYLSRDSGGTLPPESKTPLG